MAKKKDELRSARWFAPDDLRSMGHRSRAMQMGLEQEDWDGTPIIAITNKTLPKLNHNAFFKFIFIFSFHSV